MVEQNQWSNCWTFTSGGLAADCPSFGKVSLEQRPKTPEISSCLTADSCLMLFEMVISWYFKVWVCGQSNSLWCVFGMYPPGFWMESADSKKFLPHTIVMIRADHFGHTFEGTWWNKTVVCKQHPIPWRQLCTERSDESVRQLAGHLRPVGERRLEKRCKERAWKHRSVC